MIDFENQKKVLPGQESWRKYVITPKDRIESPKKYAFVSNDPESLKDVEITWKDYSDSEPLSIPADGKSSLILDFGIKIGGHLLFKGETLEEQNVNVFLGPVLDLMKAPAELTVESECGIWHDPEFKAFRYVMLSTIGKEIKDLLFEFETTHWPGDYKGWFLCDDEVLNKIWYTGAYTIQICTHPHDKSGCYLHRLPKKYGDFPKHWRSKYGEYVIWDAPRRDREIWIGDMWPECLALLYSFHAPEVMKTSLHAAASQQREDGLIPGSGISIQTFAEYACWWMALLDRLHLLTGDDDFVRDMEPYSRKLMHWLLKELDDYNGFLRIDHHQTWAWTLMRRGVVTGSQCVAVAALRGGARLMKLTGDLEFSERLASESERLRDLVEEKLWDEVKGCMKDSLEPPDGIPRVSCDSNSLAVLFGIIKGEKAKRALDYLEKNLWTEYGTKTIIPPESEENQNWAHNHNVWPFVVGLELEARFEHGDFDGAMRLARNCWGNMVDQGTECFWEMVCGKTGHFVTHRSIGSVEDG